MSDYIPETYEAALVLIKTLRSKLVNIEKIDEQWRNGCAMNGFCRSAYLINEAENDIK